jgi:4-amino-4-deoxy-L-arabinose transferase-like glycosyltransferase
MGAAGALPLDETLEHRNRGQESVSNRPLSHSRWNGWIVVAAASLVFLISVVAPPRLVDDVDAVQATIARNMLTSGDWVTARLDGVAYLEKSPLIYWMMASTYKVVGVHDWAARLPLALSCILLCWVTYRFGRWAFDDDAGLYAGLALATSVGLFLFTRILIPDAIVTLTITGAMWAWLRLLEPDESEPQRWSLILGLSMGLGLLLKGLIAVVFPVLAGVVFMAVTRQLFSWTAWKRLHLVSTIVLTLLIAAPWHVLATLRNPPCFAFSLHAGPGEYRGFFWFYFFNEHLLRFLNLRYPRDYNTVPRLLFWALNLVWLFPWSVYLLGAPTLSYQPTTRAGRTRLMGVCWIAVVMVFFSFSTTQEYYSMPIYPALALLIGSALAAGGRWARIGSRVLLSIAVLVFVLLAAILAMVWRTPTPGDISSALAQNPDVYTLSMGHMLDLRLGAFAYLKLPLALAALTFGSAALALLTWQNELRKAMLALALCMIVFLQAARIALVVFDPYLGSYPLAIALNNSPQGDLIGGNEYYAFSSVYFYTNRDPLLLNGRGANLEYGSYAPDAPHVFIDNARFAELWNSPARHYLLVYGSTMPHIEELVGRDHIHLVKENGGNFLVSNQPLPPQ